MRRLPGAASTESAVRGSGDRQLCCCVPWPAHIAQPSPHSQQPGVTKPKLTGPFYTHRPPALEAALLYVLPAAMYWADEPSPTTWEDYHHNKIGTEIAAVSKATCACVCVRHAERWVPGKAGLLTACTARLLQLAKEGNRQVPTSPTRYIFQMQNGTPSVHFLNAWWYFGETFVPLQNNRFQHLCHKMVDTRQLGSTLVFLSVVGS